MCRRCFRPLSLSPLGRDVSSILVGLRWLDVSGCGLRDVGAARVLNAIASSRTLVSIDLSRNEIGRVRGPRSRTLSLDQRIVFLHKPWLTLAVHCVLYLV